MIKKATLSDITILCDIENQLFTPAEGRFSRRIFLYHLRCGNRVFTLWEGERIAGYLLILTYVKSLRIYSLAVLPSFQGKGYGEVLCRYAITTAHQLKKDFVSLEVRWGNHKAISLYEKLGFVQKKILPLYYGNEDGLRMIRMDCSLKE